MSKHQDLVDAAEKAIDELFSDQSVSLDRTMDDLRDLRSEIDIKIGALNEDLKRSGL